MGNHNPGVLENKSGFDAGNFCGWYSGDKTCKTHPRKAIPLACYYTYNYSIRKAYLVGVCLTTMVVRCLDDLLISVKLSPGCSPKILLNLFPLRRLLKQSYHRPLQWLSADIFCLLHRQRHIHRGNLFAFHHPP